MHRRRKAHDLEARVESASVLELRRPVARATTADGEVWEVYAEVREVMEKNATLWAVRPGAHAKALKFVDFTLTEAGKELMMRWAVQVCASDHAGRGLRDGKS